MALRKEIQTGKLTFLHLNLTHPGGSAVSINPISENIFKVRRYTWDCWTRSANDTAKPEKNNDKLIRIVFSSEPCSFVSSRLSGSYAGESGASRSRWKASLFLIKSLYRRIVGQRNWSNQSSVQTTSKALATKRYIQPTFFKFLMKFLSRITSWAS